MNQRNLPRTFKSHLLFFLIILFATTVNKGFAQMWQKTNGPSAAEITHLENNGTILFSAVKKKGLFYSSDLGLTWIPTIIKSNVHKILIEDSLAVIFTDDTLYYTIDNCQSFGKESWNNNSSSLYLKNGVLYESNYWTSVKSVNLGMTWTTTNCSFYHMLINDSLWIKAANALEISSDQGQTWHTKITSPSSGAAFDYIKTSQNKVWAGNSQRIYYSGDYGRNWIVQHTFQWPIYGTKLAIHNDTLYLTSPSTLYRSSDNGVTWTEMRSKTFVSADYGSHLSIIQNTFFRGGGGVFKSSNAQHWQHASKGLEYCSSWLLNGSDNILIANVFRGLQYTTDNGDSWTTCNDADSTTSGFYRFSMIGDKLFATDFHRGLYMSPDTGKTWQYLGFRNESFWGGGVVYRNNELYYSDNYNYLGQVGKVHKTTDMGITWSSVNIDTITNPYSNYSSKLAGSPTSLVYGCQNLYASYDGGTTWQKKTNFPSTGVGRILYSNGYYFAFIDNGIYRSSDDGNTWTKVQHGGPMAVKGPYVVVETYEGIKFSTNYGHSWQNITHDFYQIQDVSISAPYIFVSVADESVWRYNAGIQTSVKEESPAASKTHRFFPNPFSDRATIEIDAPGFKTGTFVLYDVLGKVVFQTQIHEKTYTFHKNHLGEGVYFYELKDHNGLFGNGKMIIQ